MDKLLERILEAYSKEEEACKVKEEEGLEEAPPKYTRGDRVEKDGKEYLINNVDYERRQYDVTVWEGGEEAEDTTVDFEEIEG